MSYKRLHIVQVMSRTVSVLLLLPMIAFAQHPVEVRQAYARGEPFIGLSLAYQMPRTRDTAESVIATARSAWALGLPAEAERWFQRALSFPHVSGQQQAEILFSLAVIHFTEQRWEEARIYAGRASALALDDSAFRSQCHMLLGDVLRAEKRFGAAEREYLRALHLANESLAAEAHFRLGQTHYELGNTAEAENALLQLPLDSVRLPEALRLLARIAAREGEYNRARELLQQGRTRFPQQFLDSWVDFVFTRAAIADGDTEAVERIRNEARKQFPLSDPWVTLIDAEAESWLWSKRRQQEKKRQRS